MKSSGPLLSLRHVAARLLWWAPAWLPAILFVQIAFHGLRPMRHESARLQLQETVMQARVEGLLEERERLSADRRRLADPIYRARVERSLRQAGSPPLTLERAHALEALGRGPRRTALDER